MMSKLITKNAPLAALVILFAIAPACALGAAEPDDKDAINQALEEAEKLMAEQDSVIDRARRHLNVVESSGMPRTTSPLIIAPESSKPVSVAPAAATRKRAQEIANHAAAVYRDRRNYESAYELASEALRVDPQNRKAQKLQDRIAVDLDQHIDVLSPLGHPYRPPEGVIAYKIAVSDQVITLAEATDIGLKNNVQLIGYEKKIKGAERKLTEARRAMFPSLSGETTRSGGTIGGTVYIGESYKINFSQPVFDGGELLFTLRQAQANVESDKAKYGKERAEYLYRVHEAYRGTVGADYNLSYQSALFDEIDQVKVRVDKEYGLKLAAEIDYLDTLSIHNQVNFQKESAGSDLINAKLILAQEMGLDPDLPLPVDTSLKYAEIPLDVPTIRHLAREHNWDMRIKDIAVKGAYYALKIFSAKKMPKIEMRGSFGLGAEQALSSTSTNSFGGVDSEPINGVSLDLENEHFIGFEGSIPLGPNSVEYGYSRRFFAPTVSSFLGSEDYKHRAAFNLFDRLADMTDEEIAEADYMIAKAEYEKERLTTDVKAQEAYYSYKTALLQLNTSLSKIKFREKQVNILRLTTGMQEASVSSLLEQLVQLTEDRYSYVKAIGEIHSAVENINRIIGIEGYYSAEPVDIVVRTGRGHKFHAATSRNKGILEE